MGRLISNNENWSGFSFIEGPFIDAYINGKILLLDEVNLVQKSIIQCIQSSLDSDGFKEDELKGIAIKIAEKKNFTEKKIAENIGEFHHKWTTNEISKKSPQCFTIRDLSSTITFSLKKIKTI